MKSSSSTGGMRDMRPRTDVGRRWHKRREKNDARRARAHGVARSRAAVDDTANSKWATSLHALATAAGGGAATTQYVMHDVLSKRHRVRQTQDDSRLKLVNRSSLGSLPKPQLKRIQTAPPNGLADETLMNRARSIREDLRHYEMRELALEAERAAEEGAERFVGSASKFPAHEDDFVLDQYPAGLRRPSQPQLSAFFAKKIRVTSLRRFDEVIPPFQKMHAHIRVHLRHRGVDSKALLSETIQPTNDDEATYVSNASMASFSSFAMTSLRGIVEYVGRGKTDARNKKNGAAAVNFPSLSYEKQFSTSNNANFDSCCGPFEFQENVSQNQNRRESSSWKQDSSVEFYGKRNLDGRASPSSVNGVLSGVSQDDQLLQSFEFDEETPSIISYDATQSVTTFLSRMQKRFMRDKSNGDTCSERNNRFISNYFYTNQDSSIVNSEGQISNLKLEINADSTRRQDGFCISSGCVQNDLSGCESMGNAMDVILRWFSEKGRECNITQLSENQPKNPQVVVLHHSWMKTWHGDENRMFFVPPKLAVGDYQ